MNQHAYKLNDFGSNKSPGLLHPKNVTVKINHPKLCSTGFVFPSYFTCQEALSNISSQSLLKLFSNYYIQHNGKPISSKVVLGQLCSPLKPQIELDVTFQYYNYTSAMHHFEQVSKIIKQPFKLALITRNTKDELYDLVDPESLAKELLPNGFKVSTNTIEEFLMPYYLPEARIEKNGEQPQLLQFIGLSGFQPPLQAELSGDLFYIHAKTLENTDLHITASPQGFYLNQSKINNFNPSPIAARPIYTSLLDLFSNSSERFFISYSKITQTHDENLLDRIAHREDTILRCSEKNKQEWLSTAQQEHQWNVRKELSFKDIDKILIGIYDWNKMFLQIEKRAEVLKQQNLVQSVVWESTAFQKAYSLFEQAAVEGAKKIVEGKLQAMNNSQEKKKHIYVYNRIFFSITQDTIFNHSLDKGDDMMPTGSSSNTDLIQLRRLIACRPANLHVLHTVIVFYRGYRVIAQTILPGLLSSELTSLTQYGSVDDNKSINNNPQFHKLLLPICQQMHLDDNVQAFDKNNKLVPVAISPEIKGICSSNGEKYLCDLQRFSPRDLNYPGSDNQSCVLRQELLDSYIQQRGKASLLPINPNIATSIRFQETQKTQQQEQQLKAIAQYLKVQALRKLAEALKSKNSGDYLTDSQGVSKVFHMHGVNIRYLGQLYRHEVISDAIEVKICLSRVILVRCLKHLFRKALKQASPLQLSTTIAHLLNCIFARRTQIEQLQQIEEIEQKQEPTEPKRKKKKKQKEEEPKNLMNEENKIIKIEKSHYQHIRPQDLWIQLLRIAKARFDHQFQPNLKDFHEDGLFRMPYQKYATLRDLCLSVGLLLEKKNYYLREIDAEEGLPFTPKNILGFNARSKIPTNSPPNDILKAVNTADRLFSMSQFNEALRAYEEACEMLRQRGEGCQMSHCLGQISRIHYMLGRFNEAFSIQVGNLAFIYKTYREDSFQGVKCYSRLGLYCMGLGVWQPALWLLGKGLNLMLLCFGEAYPDVLINFANIARVYQLNRETQQASNCYLKAIEILNQIHRSKVHINASFCYSSLASLYYEIGQYRRSVDYQSETVNILMKTLSPEDPRYIDAHKILKVYKDINSQPRSQFRDRRK